MNTIDFANYKVTDKGIHYMDYYHPYRKGNNPNWNQFSGNILSLKEGKSLAIQYFLNLLIEKKIFDGDYSVMSVPSSDPGKEQNHGMVQFVNQFFSKYTIKKIKNGVACLKRNLQVPGNVNGPRSIQKHLDSIIVSDQRLLSECVLLLDDVSTTGSSLLACSQIVITAGAKEVVMMSLAQTASDFGN